MNCPTASGFVKVCGRSTQWCCAGSSQRMVVSITPMMTQEPNDLDKPKTAQPLAGISTEFVKLVNPRRRPSRQGRRHVAARRGISRLPVFVLDCHQCKPQANESLSSASSPNDSPLPKALPSPCPPPHRLCLAQRRCAELPYRLAG